MKQTPLIVYYYRDRKTWPYTRIRNTLPTLKTCWTGAHEAADKGVPRGSQGTTTFFVTTQKARKRVKTCPTCSTHNDAFFQELGKKSL